MSEIGRQLEEARQQQKLASAIVLGELIARIITAPVLRREHWWQLWKPK